MLFTFSTTVTQSCTICTHNNRFLNFKDNYFTLLHVSPVSTNCSLLQSHTPQSQSPPLPLPQFLSQLQQQEGVRLFEGTESSRSSTSEESGQNVVGKCCQFYNVARYNDGVSCTGCCMLCDCNEECMCGVFFCGKISQWVRQCVV